jgi:hypothetical protein
MKILLQDSKTGLYLGRGGTWCDNPHAALAFLDDIRAKDFGIYHRLNTAQVVAFAEASDSGSHANIPVVNPNPNLTPEAIVIANVTTAPTKRSTPLKVGGPNREQGSTLPRKMSTSVRTKGARKSPVGERQPTQVAAAKETFTVVEARIDVGLGNSLFIRGRGDGLSWDKGKPLSCVDASTWVWVTAKAQDKLIFKLLMNDQIWAQGPDMVVEAGQKFEFTPVFSPSSGQLTAVS